MCIRDRRYGGGDQSWEREVIMKTNKQQMENRMVRWSIDNIDCTEKYYSSNCLPIRDKKIIVAACMLLYRIIEYNMYNN